MAQSARKERPPSGRTNIMSLTAENLNPIDSDRSENLTSGFHRMHVSIDRPCFCIVDLI